jgi:hypothetical protein
MHSAQEVTAYHETGHARAAVRRGASVNKIDISCDSCAPWSRSTDFVLTGAGQPIETVRPIRDEIEERVRELLTCLASTLRVHDVRNDDLF